MQCCIRFLDSCPSDPGSAQGWPPSSHPQMGMTIVAALFGGSNALPGPGAHQCNGSLHQSILMWLWTRKGKNPTRAGKAGESPACGTTTTAKRERSFPPGLVPPRGSVLPGVSWGLLSMRIAACPLDPGASSDVSVAGWSIWIRGVPGCTGGCTVLTVATVLGCTTPQLGPSEKWQRSLAPSSQCCSLPVSKHGPRSLRSLLVGWLIQNLF